MSTRQPSQDTQARQTSQVAQVTVTTADADATRALGSRLAALLRRGDLVLLSGDLGAGKTTLAQGVGSALGVRGRVSSPTFIIARVHPSLGTGPDLIHVDAYRLESLEEVDALDLDSSMEDSVTVVEWGRGRAESLSDSRLEIEVRRRAGGEDHTCPRRLPGDAQGQVTGGADKAPGDMLQGDLMRTDDPRDPREVVVRAVGQRWAGVSLADLVPGEG
ncbi:tRNA (adenosine(37)-N6)-threonylcarbamoyltransferase complex ATPase subunit type 1 TsaE [Actinomyces lilanjuaniae]|uniref:tRNA threonylcarbamoyladenosine biosynthesis protein TsaE n=1 Tax=Actinomyces lilanjuaniae TaxID=2321394 RepID=A0ABN5PQM5_9ACTO|nr:tRNA (adenosine(37)-N6)-threonylcarbamoyltransferase complex ATPase subunit type 1 TsaE [Actinomyces lilanjuaniae]AYD89344.1 tRNA (adenosine(37)-N6)-threonylcarbamoyltransferase complex ATPase subunit type 1 TsaE [Actinomyces lilanjuaniae]